MPRCRTSSALLRSTPKTGWSEQDPDDWWEMTVEVIQEVISGPGINSNDVKAIGLSGQMHGAVLLDKSDRPLRPAIIWPDQRSSVQCRQVYQQIGQTRLAKITGSGLFPGFMLASLVWVWQNESHLWRQLTCSLFPPVI